MKVKICGITDVNTAIAATEFGADAIGFVFAESKRKITVEKAKEIVTMLPEDVLKVGVFVNETREKMEVVAELVGLTHVQLHGNETKELCDSLSFPVIKAMSIEAETCLEAMEDFPCDYLLLDGPKGKYHGGNGLAFNWTQVNASSFSGKKVILAGGLDLDNVETAIKLVNPYMVDVSSGVETNGVKDLDKIKTFITKAKGSLTGGAKR